MSDDARVPGLRKGVRFADDPVRGQAALLYPEGVLLVNDSAAAVLRWCDGVRSIAEITAEASRVYEAVSDADVAEVLTDLNERHLIVLDGTGAPVLSEPANHGETGARPRPPVPLGLVAELTYRCPLHCTYCSNPLDLAAYRDELSTDDWRRVLDEARALGVLQLHLTGGEPLLRRDLPQLVRHAGGLGMYINLITSGIGLAQRTLADLVDAGLDHFQLSLQDAEAAEADAIAGLHAHDRKLAVGVQVREHGLPLTVNAVLHRRNVEHLSEIADLAVAMGADRLELAHTQYYGWALRNRAALMPSREQVARASREAAHARQQYRDKIEIVHVLADYHGDRPKPCMNGWAARQLVVAPNGDALPCLAAAQLPGLGIVNVHHQSLTEIWYDSPAFRRFRGTDWMPEPCQSCALREVDFGGCRCQAYQLTGDASATDPACALSPDHQLVVALADAGNVSEPVPRRMPAR